MPKPTDLETAKKLIASSGNNHHCQVVRALQDRGWTTLISPYYIDPSTDRPRELDLVAERLYYIKDIFGRESRYFTIRLHVECKYVPHPTVFWFGDINRTEATQLAARYSTLHKDSVHLQQHHYLQEIDMVAKLFATENTRDMESEWMFKAVNQVLNSVINLHPQPLKEDPHRHRLHTMTYPVIVLNSFNKVYWTGLDGKGAVEQITDNFLLDVNYAYLRGELQIGQRYLIDVISLPTLDDFLKRLDAEIEGLSEMHGLEVPYDQMIYDRKR